MPEAFSLEIQDDAKTLYVVDGLTYERVAAELGAVSVGTVERWGAEQGWAEARREFRAAKQASRATLVKLQAAMLAKAVSTLDAQDVFAAVRIQSAATALERVAAGAQAQAAPDLPRLFMETLEFVAGVLKDADPEGLKILARNFDLLVERFKASHAT